MVKGTSKDELKTIEVERPIPIELDLGNLAAFDNNPLDMKRYEQDGEKYLKENARDATQVLMNSLLSLPKVRASDSTLLQLPNLTTQSPREKPLPKPKAETKWEKFAKSKGIKKKPKEGKLVYDEETGEWVPKWGFKGKNKDIENQWLVELNDNDEVDDSSNPRTKARKERMNRVAQNKGKHDKNVDSLAAPVKPKSKLSIPKKSQGGKIMKSLEKKKCKVRSRRK